ncbi:MAG: acetyl-CoA carboxylase biotin carboxyl carrier protein [Bryobacterales bacterium]|nr:acetyl-CoA carboxylase biotin carboxyl carrier protein [Bryobacteraceae bacterium]MDW8353574.1 acetyl-CoA carboxylase biotin carboxyl carrier protein [Bryobacterales bacterium]
MTIEEIKEFIRLVTESGVDELEVQRGDSRVRIRRSPPPAPQTVVAEFPAQRGANNTPPAAAVNPAAPAAEEAEAEAAGSLVIVKSPIVGTFYESPSPGASPFVQIGDTVQPGQVLCIIESMKLMNEIEAEVAGVVMKRFVENAQPVEYGEALFGIRPL